MVAEGVVVVVVLGMPVVDVPLVVAPVVAVPVVLVPVVDVPDVAPAAPAVCAQAAPPAMTVKASANAAFLRSYLIAKLRVSR
jgi:hypothetical protein